MHRVAGRWPALEPWRAIPTKSPESPLFYHDGGTSGI